METRKKEGTILTVEVTKVILDQVAVGVAAVPVVTFSLMTRDKSHTLHRINCTTLADDNVTSPETKERLAAFLASLQEDLSVHILATPRKPHQKTASKAQLPSG